MNESNWVEDSLTLGGKEVPVRLGLLPTSELRFYPENPRIYSWVSGDTGNPSQDEIQERLEQMDHVKQLMQSIKANGGLANPLVVRDGDYVVLEGNSRLAAYHILMRNDAIKWGLAKCKLLPKDIDDDSVFALLGEIHIIGTKDWAPYEQAGWLYRRQVKHGVSVARMASELGWSAKQINQLIKVYAFMVEHDDTNMDRWSYYWEYLSSHKIKAARAEYPKMDAIVVSKINSGEIPRAVDVREKVKIIAEAGGKTLHTFVTKRGTLDKCYERALARGATDVCYKRLHKFRMQLTDQETKQDLADASDKLRGKCIHELRMISRAADALMRKLERSKS
jgi:hypothetical protein